MTLERLLTGAATVANRANLSMITSGRSQVDETHISSNLLVS